MHAIFSLMIHIQKMRWKKDTLFTARGMRVSCYCKLNDSLLYIVQSFVVNTTDREKLVIRHIVSVPGSLIVELNSTKLGINLEKVYELS